MAIRFGFQGHSACLGRTRRGLHLWLAVSGAIDPGALAAGIFLGQRLSVEFINPVLPGGLAHLCHKRMPLALAAALEARFLRPLDRHLLVALQ